MKSFFFVHLKILKKSEATVLSPKSMQWIHLISHTWRNPDPISIRAPSFLCKNILDHTRKQRALTVPECKFIYNASFYWSVPSDLKKY